VTGIHTIITEEVALDQDPDRDPGTIQIQTLNIRMIVVAATTGK
jgi:hypothetical protein